MSSKLVLSINTSENSGDITPLVPVAAGAPELYIKAIRNLISKILTGAAWASIRVVQGAVSAVNAVTFSSIAAADTVTVCGTVFTGSNTPTTSVQFLTGTTDTLSAVSLAAKINAHSTVGKLVSATSTGAVISLVCNTPGLVGNFLTLAISAHGSVTGATFASGAEGNNGTLHQGI
jgi:phage tail sheath gpL-like